MLPPSAPLLLPLDLVLVLQTVIPAAVVTVIVIVIVVVVTVTVTVVRSSERTANGLRAHGRIRVSASSAGDKNGQHNTTQTRLIGILMNHVSRAFQVKTPTRLRLRLTEKT